MTLHSRVLHQHKALSRDTAGGTTFFADFKNLYSYNFVYPVTLVAVKPFKRNIYGSKKYFDFLLE
jgi:hypothetical protein